MEKIFIKIQNSSQNIWKGSLLLVDFYLKYFVSEGNLKITLSRKEELREGVVESSSPGEFHPQALTDPDVNVSAHPALIILSPS